MVRGLVLISSHPVWRSDSGSLAIPTREGWKSGNRLLVSYFPPFNIRKEENKIQFDFFFSSVTYLERETPIYGRIVKCDNGVKWWKIANK